MASAASSSAAGAAPASVVGATDCEMEANAAAAAYASKPLSPLTQPQRRAYLQQLSHAQLVGLILLSEFGNGGRGATVPVPAVPASSARLAHSPPPASPSDQSACKRAKHEQTNDAVAPPPSAAIAAAAAANASPAAAVAFASRTGEQLTKQQRKDQQRALAAAAKAAASTAAGDAPDAAAAASSSAPRKARKGGFDFSTVHLRQVAFKVMYIGTEFLGFAIQPHAAGRTVEGELARALEVTKLVDDRSATRLTRCGRTDKGVHACGQVVALQVRSRLTSGIGLLPKGWDWRVEQVRVGKLKERLVAEQAGEELWDKQGFLAPHSEKDSMCTRCAIPGLGFATDATCENHAPELDYVRMLNGVLPPSIRVVAWQPVSDAFNARFSCTARTYRYFFYADGLSLARMQREAARLQGSHDFRNFCKVDPTLNTHFTRFITNIEVRPCDQVPEDCVQITSPWPCNQQRWFEDAKNREGGAETAEAAAAAEADDRAQPSSNADPASPSPSSSSTPSSRLHPDTFCELLIHGNAFLYHQVRCMAGILFLAGRGVEGPDLVQRLLDTARTPNKPNYDMAPESPLVLYDTWFPALPSTPGFDYHPTPASNPQQPSAFVALNGEAAKSAANEDATMADSTTSVAASSPSPTPSSSSALCLYPDATICLRNVELVFAHFHHLWRNLQMQAKIYELFVNQAARNVRSVRNECDKLQLLLPESATTSKGNVKLASPPAASAHNSGSQRYRPSLPAPLVGPVRECAPLLDTTLSCRGLGLKAMSVAAPQAYASIFGRPVEKSYSEKVSNLKGKKLDRHEMVKNMSARWKKDDGKYAPDMNKTQDQTDQQL